MRVRVAMIVGGVSISEWTIAGLAVVAFAAGAIDAIAGGGGLLTMPALLVAGLPTHLALGTNKGCGAWGTAAAAWTFSRAGLLSRARFLSGFAAGAIGGSIGARVQQLVPSKALQPIVLVLLIAAAIVLLKLRPRERAVDDRPTRPALAFAISVAIGAYDGFFGPGTGTFLILANVSMLGLTLREASADAKATNLGSNVGALCVLAVGHTVLWAISLPMAIGNIAGGRLGARLAIKRGDGLVRASAIAVSLAMVVRLAWMMRR
jgi:uncharacterized membrane protein YfcA